MSSDRNEETMMEFQRLSLKMLNHSQKGSGINQCDVLRITSVDAMFNRYKRKHVIAAEKQDVFKRLDVSSSGSLAGSQTPLQPVVHFVSPPLYDGGINHIHVRSCASPGGNLRTISVSYNFSVEVQNSLREHFSEQNRSFSLDVSASTSLRSSHCGLYVSNSHLFDDSTSSDTFVYNTEESTSDGNDMLSRSTSFSEPNDSSFMSSSRTTPSDQIHQSNLLSLSLIV
ncbi:putative pentatricopeptide repeat-containing protein [Corchorus olitorius]|uniref:Pentatricopeptide repeat-containing protein n=1 Tax=Corchorus olitorius TaxID=93759 RepID=A0A1R3H7K4_9ROSI|nr:putative pentatricopeptide repeat-containing protein [Corchorus olitorius]